MKKSFNGFFAKIATKQVTKFIPLGGQIVAASLGYFMMKKLPNYTSKTVITLRKESNRKVLLRTNFAPT